MAVRYTTAPPGPTFIPSLDDVLRSARPHPGGSTLQRGDLVELVGPSGSGKTTTLIFLLMTTLLPPTTEITLPPPLTHHQSITIPLGGRGGNAAIIHPTSHRSSIPLLARAMTSHVTNSVLDGLSAYLRPRVIAPTIKGEIDRIVSASLSRLRVIRIKPRWKHLVLALKTLLSPPRLRLDPDWKGKEDALDSLAIDGFGDPFWPERWVEEERGVRRSTVGIRAGDDVGMRDVMSMIEGIRRELGTVVVLSIQALWSNSASPFYTPHLPPPYPTPFIPPKPNEIPSDSVWGLNIQITLLGRVRPLQLPADTTLTDAVRTLELGPEDKMHTSQRFEGIVRVVNGAGEAGTLRGSRFIFHIGPDGLEALLD